MKYMVGTRGSKLAVAQTSGVCEALGRAYPEHEFEIKIIKTKGDLIQDRPLDQIGDKGVFVKEIEEQLLSGEVQIGVHSMKDMPAFPAQGLEFAQAWEREDPRDALILREAASLEELPPGAVIGTGSRRREVQLKRLRQDLRVVNIRGNVDTRLRKMEEQKLDGIVLAAAGLHRLGKKALITRYLDPEEMIPAPAQGVLALEIRAGDVALKQMLDGLKSGETSLAVAAERGFLAEMGANCHMPVGAYCHRLADGSFRLLAMFGREEGQEFKTANLTGTDPVALGERAAFRIRRQMAGKVLLVGGGPGDPGLITVKGLKAVQQADCIVYDRLVSGELLQEAKPECELIYVGKEDRRHTMRQEEINELLVSMAMKYSRVVRLKGGDPYVFGRGGEEALFLQEKGVSFEVIPGVSSSVAGLAYAGIPITHRGLAGGFHVVTAHDRQDELADIDFKAMAAGRDTCVFLMGLSKVREIARRLMEEGMAPDTPAAVISNATTLRQKTCSGELSGLADAVEAAGLKSPALIVVGKVAGLRERLDFFEKRLLTGKRFLIARIEKETAGVAGRPAEALEKPVAGPKTGAFAGLSQETVRETAGPAALLRAAGAETEEITVGKIVYRPLGLTREFLQAQEWLIFTSRNGVESFFADLKLNGIGELPEGIRIAVVGKKTQESLEAHGRGADLISTAACGENLAERLKGLLTGTEKVCFFGAEYTDSCLEERLSPYCRFEERVAYENRSVAIPSLETEQLAGYDGIVFTCASSVRRFAGGVQGTLQEMEAAGTHFYSIGPKCTGCLEEYGLKAVRQAKEASYEALAECVMDWENGRLPEKEYHKKDETVI